MYHILYLINMTVCIHWMRCIYVLLSRNKAVQFLDLKWIGIVSHWLNLMTQWPRATQWFQNTITPMTQYKVVLEGQWLTCRVVSGGLRWSHLHKLVRGVGRHYRPVITTLPAWWNNWLRPNYTTSPWFRPNWCRATLECNTWQPKPNIIQNFSPRLAFGQIVIFGFDITVAIASSLLNRFPVRIQFC